MQRLVLLLLTSFGITQFSSTAYAQSLTIAPRFYQGVNYLFQKHLAPQPVTGYFSQ